MTAFAVIPTKAGEDVDREAKPCRDVSALPRVVP
jgi:hypothetical protein